MFLNLFTHNRVRPEEARELLDKGEATLVDVRTPGEYSQGHIPDALLIPLDRLAFEAPVKLPDKEAKLLIYCLSGNRSRTAVSILSRNGYTDVHDLGGITSWPYKITV